MAGTTDQAADQPHHIDWTGGTKCGICTAPATHMVTDEGWNGPACALHADHAERTGATITAILPVLTECDVCGYAMADLAGQPSDQCTNPVCGGGDEARARFAAAAVRHQQEDAERAHRHEMLRLSLAPRR